MKRIILSALFALGAGLALSACEDNDKDLIRQQQQQLNGQQEQINQLHQQAAKQAKDAASK